MNNEVLLGKASYGRSGGGNVGWFYVEDNKDNIYRVLPPMKSLAPHGKYAKFYATHRGFRGSDNKQKPFLCIEESNYKSKQITVHCPVCDWVNAIEAEIANYKAKGATDEQIREYRNKNVFPFQAERKYYVNVVNQENKIGILAIGSKMFKSLEALAIEQEKLGRDITGMEGYFLNFKKQTRFKGDRDAIHTATMYMSSQQDGSFRFVNHTITAEFAQRLGPEAADLGNLFKTLDAEQIARIVSLEGASRAEYVDLLFAAPEKDQAAQSGMQSQIPGTNLTAVSRVESSPNGGFQVQQPTLPPVQQSVQPAAQQAPAAAPAAPVAAPVGAIPGFGQTQTPAAAPQQTGLTNFGPSVPPLGAGVMPGQSAAKLDDAEFANMVRPIKG